MAHALNRRLLTLVLGAGLCAGVSGALAQDGSDAPAREGHTFDKPLNQRPRSTPQELALRLRGPEGGGSTTNVTVIENGTRYELRIRDGEHSAKINGEPVPEERIRVGEGKVELLGEDGSVVYTFETGKNLPEIVGPEGLEKMRLELKELERVPGRRWLVEPERNGQGFRFALPDDVVQAAPPPVMLGISMSEPNQDVLEHLGLPEDGAILVSAVQDDLPAAEAGMQVNDLIVSADGTRPINAGKLREILATKKDGDTIKLIISRKGKEETLDVKLRAWDSEKMRWAGGQEPMRLQMQEGASARDEALRDIEKAIETLKAESEQTAEKVRETAIEALESAREALREARLGMGEMLREMMNDDGRVRAFVFGDGPGEVFERFPEPPVPPVAPGAPRVGGGAGNGREGDREAPAMDALQSQLEVMTRTLEKMNERLERLEEKNPTQPR